MHSPNKQILDKGKSSSLPDVYSLHIDLKEEDPKAYSDLVLSRPGEEHLSAMSLPQNDEAKNPSYEVPRACSDSQIVAEKQTRCIKEMLQVNPSETNFYQLGMVDSSPNISFVDQATNYYENKNYEIPCTSSFLLEHLQSKEKSNFPQGYKYRMYNNNSPILDYEVFEDVDEYNPQTQFKSASLLRKLYLERQLAVESSPPREARVLGEFSSKVFVGGLPIEMEEEEIIQQFSRFGNLTVDMPFAFNTRVQRHRYAFLVFEEEKSVRKLIDSCVKDGEKYYAKISTKIFKYLTVQIRPWILSEAVFVVDPSKSMDPRKIVFVGGVPRALKAIELAAIIDELYGGICCSKIDLDYQNNYPKGIGYVCFNNKESYMAAILTRFVRVRHSGTDKRLEIKPYILDNQQCDGCLGVKCEGNFAPYFCASVNCLKYYCDYCWLVVHSVEGGELHKRLVKQGVGPKVIPWRWYFDPRC